MSFWKEHGASINDELHERGLPVCVCPSCGAETFELSADICRFCGHRDELIQCDLCRDEVWKSETEELGDVDPDSGPYVLQVCQTCLASPNHEED